MMRDNHVVRRKIKTSIPLVLKGVANEDTPGKAWSELVGSEVGVVGTSEDPKVRIGGSSAKEGKVERGCRDCFGGKEVEEIGGGVKALNPVAGWERRMEQQGVHDIIGGVNHALDLVILRGGVGARYPKLDVVGEEEGVRGGVVELSSVVALDTTDGATKLHKNIGEEVRESGESVRFEAQRKSLGVMSTIIKNNQVVLITKNTHDRRCPKITVDQIKRSYNPRRGTRKRKSNMSIQLTRMT
jgi:hypothetical protein